MPKSFNPTLATWNRKRAGKRVRLYTVNWRCPDAGKKRRKSFAKKADAESYCEERVQRVAGERYFNPNTNPTLAEVADHWCETKRGSVKAQTMKGYAPLLKIIVGPLLQGTPQERAHHALTGEKPRHDTKLLLMLGNYRVSSLMTTQLRQWHNRVCIEVGIPTANRCMFMLKSIMALAEEGYGVRFILPSHAMLTLKTQLFRRSTPRLIFIVNTLPDHNITTTFGGRGGGSCKTEALAID